MITKIDVDQIAYMIKLHASLPTCVHAFVSDDYILCTHKFVESLSDTSDDNRRNHYLFVINSEN